MRVKRAMASVILGGIALRWQLLVVCPREHGSDAKLVIQRGRAFCRQLDSYMRVAVGRKFMRLAATLTPSGKWLIVFLRSHPVFLEESFGSQRCGANGATMITF